MSRANAHQLPDFEDKSAMYALMSARLTETDGGFYYPETWSDLLIAQTVNPNFKAHHAATIRLAKFGKLVKPPEPTALPPSPMDILEARILRIIDVLAANSPRSAQHRRYLMDGPSATAHLDDI